MSREHRILISWTDEPTYILFCSAHLSLDPPQQPTHPSVDALIVGCGAVHVQQLSQPSMHPPLLARKQVRVRAFQCNIYPKCEKVMRQPQLHMCMRVKSLSPSNIAVLLAMKLKTCRSTLLEYSNSLCRGKWDTLPLPLQGKQNFSLAKIISIGSRKHRRKLINFHRPETADGN
jgi:hypothetical protein